MELLLTNKEYTSSIRTPVTVIYLLDSGADPNIQDKTGKTALMHACLKQAGAEVLTLLLDSSADPSLEDHSGSSALVYAVNAGDKDVLRVLLNACKAKGKEVIIITTDQLPSGLQMTKQYLSVPPPPDPEERLHYTPAACSCMAPSGIHLHTPPQVSSADTSPRPGSPLLNQGNSSSSGLVSGAGSASNSQPGSPTRDPSPLRGHGAATRRLPLQRLHSEPWLTIPPSLLLQQSKSSSFTTTEDLLDISPEEELSYRVNGLGFRGRRSQAVSRHQSIDVKDATGLLKALEQAAEREASGGGGRKRLGRKMSYDGGASPRRDGSDTCAPVDKYSSDCLPNLAVSSLQNVRRCNIGMDRYSSDSQLLWFGNQQRPEDGSRGVGGSGGGSEKRKLVTSRSTTTTTTLSGSRESLESSVQRRGPLERRNSGALLLDHIAHTRPGYLPPLNPHAPIPDIGVSPASICPMSASNKALDGGVPKLPVPCAPLFPRDLKAKTLLLRRHSMQTEQMIR